MIYQNVWLWTEKFSQQIEGFSEEELSLWQESHSDIKVKEKLSLRNKNYQDDKKIARIKLSRHDTNRINVD